MSDGSGEGDDAVLTDFLEAYLADRERGVVRSLDDYLVQFPGHAEAIAKEFLSLEEGDAIAREHRTGKRGTPALADIATGDVPGDRIGHYRVLDEIGRGGQGIVYLAEDTRLHRKVALKVLKGMGSLSKDAVARFRREAEAASRLDHPGICAVYEAALDGKVPYIAMRLVEGESLGAKIASARSQGEASAETSFVHLADGEAPLSPPGRPGTDPSPTPSGPTTRAEIMRVVQLIENVARALHAAHEAGVLHRDMKPGNVMVTPEGEAVIMDFGLAYLEDDQLPTLTQTGEFMGTPAYMAPEQLLVQHVRLDRRADVWSLGVMLYECVTLTRPFDAPTREGLYQAIMTKEPPDLRRLNPAIPTDLRIVVATAIEKDRDRRYQTALDLAEELRRIRCFEPIQATPAGPILRFRRWAQRNPVLATAVGGVFGVLAVGLTVALLLLGQRDRALDERGKALEEVTRQRNENAGWALMGEITSLHTLVNQADTLWPVETSKVEAMKTWIEEAQALADRLPDHERFLEELRASALPLTEEEERADSRAHSQDIKILDDLHEQRERALAEGPPPERYRAYIARLDTDIARQEKAVRRRRTWKFARPVERLKYETAAKLVSELTSFANGLLGSVRGRLASAEYMARDLKTAEQETVGKYATRWSEAIKTIADEAACPKYGGLRIKPQAGLIPIGKDPSSGLFEFAHYQTSDSATDPIPLRGQNGRLVITESSGLVFVLLPGGRFQMGAVRPDKEHAIGTPNVDADASERMPYESPVKEVSLDPFFISKYEMTKGQWLRATVLNPSYGPYDGPGITRESMKFPVDMVSWNACAGWFPRLGLVLPTEAQWEYAARGGTTTVRWTGDGTDGLYQAENLSPLNSPDSRREDSGDRKTVGSLLPNPFGLHDVLGNVYEWCRDEYTHYDAEPRAGDGLRVHREGSLVVGAIGARSADRSSSAEPPSSRSRVRRGGCWTSLAVHARSAFRTGWTPDSGVFQFGVRPAMSCRLD